MARGAKVTSIAVLREFRPALIKFVEEGRVSLIAAEAECNRTLEWLRNDRVRYWKKELRKRQDDINRCKTELLNKQRSATGEPRSAVEERKALDKAKYRLEEAVTKQANTKRWLRQLEKEHMQYKGMAQGLSGQLTRLEDMALHDLDRMAEALEDYVSMAVPTAEEIGEAPRPPGYRDGESFAGGVEAGEQVAPPSPFASYRHATASAGRRRRAEPGHVQADTPDTPDTPVHQLDRTHRQRQHDELAALLMDDPPAEDSTLSLSRGALAERCVYLERCEPVDEQDSGWYLASVGESGPRPDRRELVRVPLSGVLAVRPDLEAALRLCIGSLVVADGGQVQSVTAPNDTLVYGQEEGT
jgi:hypothetical protein